MLKPLFSKLDLDSKEGINSEFYSLIKDEINTPCVQKMKEFSQHGKTSCFQHCVNVSYYNFLLCKLLNLDYKSAARAGLLHDLFLYDWHNKSITLNRENHALSHPKTALKNAETYFELNKIEKDIILKHMFPIGLKMPKYKETIIIIIVDKFCGLFETILRF